MILANFMANMIGLTIVEFISHRSIAPPPPEMIALGAKLDMVYVPISLGLMVLVTLLYERPIRRFIDQLEHPGGIDPHLEQAAQRKTLNEPYFLVGADCLVWFGAAIVYTAAFATLPIAGRGILVRVFLQTVVIGMITACAAFFWSERIVQKQMAPLLFPRGGLFNTPQTHRIRVRTRIMALIIAVNISPCCIFIVIARVSYHSQYPPAKLLELLRSAMITNSMLFMFIGLVLTLLVTSNLTRAFWPIVGVLKKVRSGNLNEKVPVTSNDEIGYVGDVINEMTDGLKEREQLRYSLELARQVQLNLLPKAVPCVPQMDIAGRSVYCDQTGGDYFDYFRVNGRRGNQMGLVVGDVSGHGIPSALLMATARAFLRLRSHQPGSLAQMITDVNLHLTRDVEETGQFMTLFYMLIDPEQGVMRWVRAGHDPAILYDPGTDTIQELWGDGIALGVSDKWEYAEVEKKGLASGQVLVIGTDGIWEATNARGEMFGKAAFYDLIRLHHAANAAEIVARVLHRLHQFQGNVPPQDDITLVVAKI